MNLFRTLELLASPGLFIQQIHVAGQILNCLLEDQRWQRGSLAERHLTTDWSGALTAPCVAPLSTFPGTLRHLGSTRSQKQLSDLQRNVSDSIYNIQNMCYDTNMKPSEQCTQTAFLHMKCNDALPSARRSSATAERRLHESDAVREVESDIIGVTSQWRPSGLDTDKMTLILNQSHVPLAKS